jgi:primosomal protein N' (replication factor Y)
VLAVDAASAALPAFDVAVGTEAALHRIADGAHDRPVHLVAFLEFDQELLAARYRAGEQALWLLVRAARLVGPRAGAGLILIQTRNPDDPVIRAAVAGDPQLVLDAERDRRSVLRFPPFGALASISGAAAAVSTACDALRAQPLDILGPEALHPGGSDAVAGALIRAPSVTGLCDALAATDLSTARGHGRLRIEVDPLRV